MKCLKTLLITGLWSCTIIGHAQVQTDIAAQGMNGVILEDTAGQGAQAAMDAAAVVTYWTPARMAGAKPMPTPLVSVEPASLLFPPIIPESAVMALPGYARGCRPNAGNCDSSPHSLTSKSSLFSASTAYGDLIQPMHGDAPVNPKDGPYGPFQRWREAVPITSYPKSTIGKLFFSLGGSNFVCSASVVNRSTLITAGHCNSDGNGNFATNRIFCPSYTNGAHPGRGCWAVVTSAISTRWHTLGDPDYDYSCLVTATTGTVFANKIGNITGWLGRAWNFPSSQAERTFGYAAASPFTGGLLQTTASTEWYTVDFVGGGQVSKIIGSDLTGGSSGGPWILGWTGGLAEIADTDGSFATDPGNNWVNGVNSHKRCLVNCDTPPTATNGVFWQELTSPPFRNTTADGGESEDVLAVCFANPNN